MITTQLTDTIGSENIANQDISGKITQEME